MDDKRRNFRRLEREESEVHRDSVEFFMDELEGPDTQMSKVWFICNSGTPELNNINAVVRIEQGEDVINSALNSERGLISKNNRSLDRISLNRRKSKLPKINLNKVIKESVDQDDDLERDSVISSQKFKHLDDNPSTPDKRPTRAENSLITKKEHEFANKQKSDEHNSGTKEVDARASSNSPKTKITISKAPTVNLEEKLKLEHGEYFLKLSQVLV